MLLFDRHLGSHFFDAGRGGDPAVPHRFWFSGPPEVYILILPAFGIVSAIIPRFSQALFGALHGARDLALIDIPGRQVWAITVHGRNAGRSAIVSSCTRPADRVRRAQGVQLAGTTVARRLTFETPMLSHRVPVRVHHRGADGRDARDGTGRRPAHQRITSSRTSIPDGRRHLVRAVRREPTTGSNWYRVMDGRESGPVALWYPDFST